MGQSFSAILIGPRGGLTVVDPFTYGSGVKLTEHSWIGARFPNAVLSEVVDRPKRIAWIGEYSLTQLSEDQFSFSNGFISSKDQYKIIYDEATGRHSKALKVTVNIDVDCADWFVVNESKKIFFDLEQYVCENITADGWCLHPVPLLTAVGNGLGGGDFYGKGIEDIGKWAFDKISISKYLPDSRYSEVFPSFIESGAQLKPILSFANIIF